MKLRCLWAKVGNPRTPDIEEATIRAEINQKQAEAELASAKKLAEALAEIRQKNGLGESLSIIFGGGNHGTGY